MGTQQMVITGVCQCCQRDYAFCPKCRDMIYGKKDEAKGTISFECGCGWKMEKENIPQNP